MDRAEIIARNLRAEQFFGEGIDRLFPAGASSKQRTPWETAGHLKDRRQFKQELVNEALRRPPQLQDIDPVDLLATQPSVLRHHVEHYMTGDYERTGETSSKEATIGNRFPMVYRREPNPLNPDTGVQNLILSGHHRAAAALVQGKPLRAIIVEGPYGDKYPK